MLRELASTLNLKEPTMNKAFDLYKAIEDNG
jgi:hypothetical protein